MNNYPGCAPPYCVFIDGGIPEAGGDAFDAYADAPADAEVDAESLARNGSSLLCALCGDAGTRPIFSCSLQSFGGATVIKCQPDCTGRRPAGLRATERRARAELGDYFAQMAYLEAASITAFERLKAELTTHGAPAHLILRAQRAARDEVRHAHLASALARRFGGRPERPVIDDVAPRTLEQIALENAVEGCSRETFGALVATWQASAAGDPHVRQVMRAIARDETEHAALAWNIAAWLDGPMDAKARRTIAHARQIAFCEMQRSIGNPSNSLARTAGVPRTATARALLWKLLMWVRGREHYVS